ncbi:MAG: hypothetical protein KF830_09775 [Planctomycetes bacterium]|nr:hypothetical protein [Planctomycetota bacterium]
MTQLDVPQVSLQRYLDLLKRRRWQVIPVSLVGLLLGGLVAFFIPRYYVAETLLVHQLVPGRTDPRNAEDPFRSIVDSARLTIPLAVGETMRELKWPEAMVADPSLRTLNERQVNGRLSVVDLNQFDRDREHAQIRVTYRDRDGQRAANFLNKLVPTWIAATLRSLREPAEADQRRANEAANNHRRLYEQLAEERRQLALRYQIDPSEQVSFLRLQLQAEEQRAQTELRNGVEQVQREVEAARRLLQRSRDLLADTPARVQPDADVLLVAAKASPEGLRLSAMLLRYREMQRNFRDGTDGHRQATLGIAQIEQKLRELVGTATADADGLMPNPLHRERQQAVEEQERALAVLEADLATREAQLAGETARVARRAQGFVEYERKVEQLADAKKDLDAATERLRAATAVVASLGKQQTVQQVGQAQPPPRPTDPNILVVALIGCVVGLGAAIGLILLLDIVQGTFKTLDDVERGLPVPVLGGISHLETEAEREAAVGRRRLVSWTAAAFVALVVVLVTIFYVDPTRLHPLLRDLLAVLLGS